MLAWVIGTWEMVAIVAVALLLFGSRLPNIARSVGKSIVEFKKGVKDAKDGLDVASTETPAQKIEDKQPVTVQKGEEKAKEPVA